jgi:Nucleotide modification associated domain 3
MKIVLSRKGFDGSAGECASPIVGGQLLSLPIPDKHSPIAYRHITIGGINIGPVVEDLTGHRISRNDPAHLDPDLDVRILPSGWRPSGWCPAFGATGSHQGHLTKQCVESGDLFLFFGWYKEAHLMSGHWQFKASASNLHILFGWLQVDKVLNPVTTSPAIRSGILAKYPWLRYHPNLSSAYLGDSKNTIYTAKQLLNIPGLTQKSPLPGAGLFISPSGYVNPKFILTTDPPIKRSLWKLANWRLGSTTIPLLSFHGNRARWTTSANDWLLQTVGRGQEFVIDTGHHAGIVPWVHSLF